MKADYKRYAKVGPGGVRCPCCNGGFKHGKKKAARHTHAHIIDLLIEDELAPVVAGQTHADEPCWINPNTLSPDDLLTDRQREDMEYLFWAKGEAVPDFQSVYTWREYGDGGYVDSCRYSTYSDTYNANDYLNAEIEANGYIMAKTGEPNAWEVRASRWNTIARVKMDGFEWRIVFAPYRGELVTYTFDYMESSLNACFTLIQTLHRIDCGSEV